MPVGSEAKVSVVVATYNGAEFLARQLESILAQTHAPSEIIVSDDGSSDSTLDIVTKFQNATPGKGGPTWRVLLRKKPLGVAGNFASALAVAKGDLVAFADQDDVWEANKLEALIPHFDDARTLLAHSDALLIDAKGRETGSLMRALRLTARERSALRGGRALDALLRRNLVTGATMMIRRSLLETALPIPAGWIHDEWLALIAALQGGVVFDQRPLVRYRQHGANQIGASRLSAADAGERLREKRSTFFARKASRNTALVDLVALNRPWLHTLEKDALMGKLQHDQWRSELPEAPLGRVLPILVRWLSGHYSRYARGHLDVVRDLVLRD
jgi:glycosyltransferase involved in cell wall biosynthesis